MIRRVVFVSLLVILAACGRLGPPQPPAGEPVTYPKAYPSANP